MALSRAPSISQLSTYLKCSICIAKIFFDPLNKVHQPILKSNQTNETWKSLLYSVNVLFQNKNYQEQG